MHSQNPELRKALKDFMCRKPKTNDVLKWIFDYIKIETLLY